MMMTSQLGRLMPDSSSAKPDAANSKPDEQGRYSPMDELLSELSERMGVESASRGDRRPDDSYSTR